jgi:predicted DNA-binding transcriptional regulator AlpA
MKKKSKLKSQSAAPAPQFAPIALPSGVTVLTITELAAMLKTSRRSIYSLTRRRSQNGVNPCPVLRIPALGIRFKLSAVNAWLERCAA